jgi:hypothetical protein
LLDKYKNNQQHQYEDNLKFKQNRSIRKLGNIAIVALTNWNKNLNEFKMISALENAN